MGVEEGILCLKKVDSLEKVKGILKLSKIGGSSKWLSSFKNMIYLRLIMWKYKIKCVCNCFKMFTKLPSS